MENENAVYQVQTLVPAKEFAVPSPFNRTAPLGHGVC